MKEVVVDLTLENSTAQKALSRMGETRHEIFPHRQDGDHPAVEQSPLAGRRTLEKLGIPRSSFDRWYDPDQRGGPEALAIARHGLIGLELYPRGYPQRDRRPGAGSAGTEPAGTGGALHRRARILVSEASVYRLLKAHDLITSPAYIVIKRPSSSRTRPRRPTSSGNNFTYLKITAAAGTISRPCSTTSRASSSPGSSARR